MPFFFHSSFLQTAPFSLYSLSPSAQEQGFHLASMKLREHHPTPSNDTKWVTQLSGLYWVTGACHLSRTFPSLSQHKSMSSQWPLKPPATSPAPPLSRQARPVSGAGPCCPFFLELSPWVPLRLTLTWPSGLCAVRLLPSTIHSLRPRLHFTSLLTYAFICFSIYCCSLCSRMNTPSGKELCFCSLKYPQNLDSNLAGIRNSINIRGRNP